MTESGKKTGSKDFFSRPLQNEGDYWRVHRMMVEAFPILPVGFNWDIRRWEGSGFYDQRPGLNLDWASKVRLWETADGKVVGAVHSDWKWIAALQVDPSYRQLVEEDMLAWAEENLAAPSKDEQGHEIWFYIMEYDTFRQGVVKARGYERTEDYGVIRHLRFGHWPIPRPEIADGYLLRETRPGNLEDGQKLADLLNAAFMRTFHNAEEYINFAANAPSHRHDLHLVAEAPDGSFAAHVGLPYDETNRHGIFEPVCTHPDHRRLGLSSVLMYEAMHRARALGAAHVTVETGDMEAANRFYASLGFTEMYRGWFWRKTI